MHGGNDARCESFILDIAINNLTNMHAHTHAHRLYGQFPGVEGVRGGTCSLALLECSVCDEKREAAAFPMQTPRHTQAAPVDRGHGPLTPLPLGR